MNRVSFSNLQIIFQYTSWLTLDTRSPMVKGCPYRRAHVLPAAQSGTPLRDRGISLEDQAAE
jgi:hypothetical protein